MDRRTMLKLAGIMGSCAVIPQFAFQAQAREVVAEDTVSVVTVSDGSLQLPPSFVIPDVPEDELKQVLNKLPDGDALIERPLNLTLLRDGERTVLFDVGSGPNFMPSAGKLSDSLDAAGVSPEEVTDIVFTHGHPDHLWGILDDFDEVWFPEASLHFPRIEFEFWMDASTINKMPEERKVFAVGAKNRLEAIEDQVQLFEAGAEVVPKVEAVATYGHTPGHTSFMLHSASEPILVVGDAMTSDIISFQRPDWPAGGDQDPQTAAATRKMLLDRLVSERARIIGYHLSNDGVGRVEAAGGAYRFIPT